ncbi:uroporphyrinogen-III C-methyltransferase [Arthrobacter halodurans]|uniref:uroporphyrinogen-III C-methyltransferase n=1 Tax=Arthrobacter halodurans TaxID=516699 RepID=A0ABV4UKI2_9MICC
MGGTPELRGHRVVVAGAERAARHAVARCRALGADVTPAVAPSSLATLDPALRRASLVVAVDDGNPGWDILPALCRERRILLVRERPAPDAGSVTLVGGGPGAADLVTVRGAEALARADVVFYDRLGPYGTVAGLAPGAELVDVGKLPGHHKVPQLLIERLVVEAALAGKSVVRLKGGDPFVFGRGGEEVAACVAAGISVTVVPGITSAVSVPGAAGIPVTHRGVSRMFTVASGHQPFSEAELEHLAGLGGTIVVLMGVGTLPQTVGGLLRHGLDPATPAAIVERGFSDTQRSTVARIDGLVVAAGLAGCTSPAVVVIGDVVAVGADAAAELAGYAPAGARR